MVSFVVVGLPSTSFNSHHLRVAERHHCLHATSNREDCSHHLLAVRIPDAYLFKPRFLIINV